ncbi:MAG: dihydroorotase [Gammaproteobacteria bacterium]|nr:dihydroorotase [Gammaproteobacteria bacterium]MCP5136439.1 dihydroorotase [Gammaproteobacteria bacterium]
MSSLLITNARLVNEGAIVEGDLRVRDGRIVEIGSGISKSADQVIDAAGRVLMPAMIDDQVHFRDPGLTHKGDLATESRAAVAGGIASFMEMPNTNPQTVTSEALEAKYAHAAERAVGNHAFYLGATNDNLAEIQRLDPNAACGVKVFMGASTGNMLVDREEALDGIFRDAPCLIATHCEDTPMIKANEEAFRAKYGEDVPYRYHGQIRSAEACLKSSQLAISLAKRHGSRLHVLHLTTAIEMDQFEPGPVEGKRITAEVCAHHLYFSDADYDARGSFIKCNPAIKTAEDRAALRRALIDSRIDVVATDHAPHTLDEKTGTYFKTPAGLPLVQYALPSLLERYHAGEMSLEMIVEKTSHNVARCYDIVERGFLREGYWADLALVDLDAPFTVKRSDVLSKCGWSPFEGDTFRSHIDATVVSGRVAYQDGRIVEGGVGKRLQFDRKK